MKNTVLVVDDEILIRKSLSRVLREKGYLVEGASTGAEGLEKVESVRPQVIILDMRLPDTDGLFTFLNESLEGVDGITHTETWHVLRTGKFFYNWEGEDVRLEPSPKAPAAGQRRRQSVAVPRPVREDRP